MKWETLSHKETQKIYSLILDTQTKQMKESSRVS